MLPCSPRAAGNNVGDCCRISLPRWVLEAGERDPDIFFTDSSGYRNRECLSVGCDMEPVLPGGRTPLQARCDFIAAFADEFADMLGSVVTEVTVGMGPAGELRYPSYPEGDGRWRFPGIGQFQCYDKWVPPPRPALLRSVLCMWLCVLRSLHKGCRVALQLYTWSCCCLPQRKEEPNAAAVALHAPEPHLPACLPAQRGFTALPDPAWPCRYMLASLREAAIAAGHPEWGHGGPHDSGNYNSHTSETGFFKSYGGSWDTGVQGGARACRTCRVHLHKAGGARASCHQLPVTLGHAGCALCLWPGEGSRHRPPRPLPTPANADYGRFFLSWYSGLLIQHADQLLGAAKAVLSQRCRPRAMREARELSDGGMLYVFEPAVQLSIKLAGVHWCGRLPGRAVTMPAAALMHKPCDSAHRCGLRHWMAARAIEALGHAHAWR